MKSELYTKFAQQYDAAVQDNVYNALLDRVTLLSMSGNLSGLDILDLGCGPGVYAKYLLEQKVSNLTCIDASEEMIDIVKNKFGERVTAYSQDLSTGLPKEKSNSADVVICPLMIHYLKDLSPLFQDISRVLRDEGYFIFSTHHPFSDFKYSRSRNYFKQEQITQEWDTVGTSVKVTFYRRSLTEIINAITENGMCVTELSEGKVDVKAEDISTELYGYLSKNPAFIFIKCEKRAQ